MKIDLSKYRVTSDGSQFIVAEVRTVQKKGKTYGNEYEANQKYFSSLDGLISHLLQQEIMESDVTTLEQMFAVVKEFKAEIKKIMG